MANLTRQHHTNVANIIEYALALIVGGIIGLYVACLFIGAFLIS